MKAQTLTTIYGNIGAFNVLLLFDLSKSINQKDAFRATENGEILINVNPGKYYLVIGDIKKTSS